MILIRTNCNGTLGHLARCAHLAQLLDARGHTVEFILDTDAIPAGYTAIDAYTRHALHPALPQALDTDRALPDALQIADADRVLAVAARRNPTLVMIDDYRLDAPWEERLRSQGYPVLAIDDTCRSHHVDILVEPGYRHTRPEVHVAPPAVHLAGESYALLGPDYRIAHPAPFDTARPTVLLSLGGGGDLSILAAIVQAACDRPQRGGLDTHFIIVRGPASYNAETLSPLLQQHADRVSVIDSPPSLAPWLQHVDLFVGAAGTALYETAACRTPALTFALADNQINVHAGLQRIGHYLHLPGSDRQRPVELAELIHALLGDRVRLRALHDADHGVDGNGCLRVVDAIENPQAVAGADNARIRKDHPSRSDPVPDVAFTRCTDRDINQYLDSRNLAANCRNMTSTAQIDRLQHYRWWFTTSRSSWRMDLDGEPQLYIWEQERRIGELDVLFGGWFVCRDEVAATSAMLALQWQLERTDSEYPRHVWVAVISRDNPFVYRMNQRAGFVDALPGSKEALAVQACFPQADPAQFHLVYRRSAGAVSGCAR